MRQVTLCDDQDNAIGNVVLPSDYPSDPGVVTWKGKIFVAGSISFSPAPGAYESYVQSESLEIPVHAVSAPSVVPTPWKGEKSSD